MLFYVYFSFSFVLYYIKANELILKYKYMKFFQLLNENYLLCSEKGIHLYDSQIKNKINETLFSTEISSADEFYFVNIEQFSIEEGGYVIILYKDVFYFYSYSGFQLFSCDLPFSSSGKAYTLVLYKNGDQFNFIIGYIGDGDKTMIGYYNINISNKLITEITTKNIILRSASNVEQTTSNSPFNCQIMKSATQGKKLVCFYIVTYYFGINSYNIDDNFSETTIGYAFDKSIGTSYIQSATNSEKDKSIVCCQNGNDGKTVCLCYDINSNTITSKKIFGENIQNSISSVTFLNSKKTNEIIISSINYEGYITIAKFDNDLIGLEDENTDYFSESLFHISDCTYSYGSFVYFSENNGYSFLASCGSETTGIKIYSLPESFNPSEVNPKPSYNENQNSSSSSSSNSSTINSSSSVKTSTLPEIQKISSTFIINENPKTNLPKDEDNLTSMPKIEENPTNINEVEYNHQTTLTEDEINLRSSFIELEDNPILNFTTIEIKSTTNYNEIQDKSITTLPKIEENPNYFSETQSFNSYTQNLISVTSQINKNNFYYDEKTNKTIFLKDEEPCPEQFLYKNKDSKECVKSCEIQEIINNDCSVNLLTLNNVESITNNMRNIINNTNINKETNIVIEGDNVVYQIISSENMEDNKNKNISIIDLGDCETKLKKLNNISELLFFKMDLNLNNTPPMILNYEIYNPYTFQKLNLEICKDNKITIYSPYTPAKESLNKFLKLNESGYDLYNPKDSFYQDLCSPFTSENGTDIPLSDRKIDFFENISLCEDSCSYEGYDYIIKKVKCECNIKKEIDINQFEIKEKTFFSSFKLDKLSNIKVFKCFKLVFSKKGQTNNKGSYIFIVVIIFSIILSIVFYINQIKKIAGILRKAINSNYIKKNRKNNSPPSKKTIKNKKNISKKIINDINITTTTQKKNSTKDKLITSNEKRFKRASLNQRKIKRNSLLIFDTNSKNNKCLITLNSKRKIFNSNKSMIPIKKLKQKNKNIKNNLFTKKQEKEIYYYNYNDEELNKLNYNEAILYDKRTFCRYYLDLIKRKQLILFTFFSNNDYNIFYIKLSLFLFSFSLYFTVSALFFEDKTMHKIYQSKGNFNFLIQIPPIIYSTIISSIINIIANYLALSNKDILKIKKIKDKEKALKESVKLKKNLKIKFNLFFLISFIFLIFFWYFIAAFCAVYKNTQGKLFENTIGSFLLSLLYPFGINLLPGIFRIPALRTSKKNLEGIYKVSQILALI